MWLLFCVDHETVALALAGYADPADAVKWRQPTAAAMRTPPRKMSNPEDMPLSECLWFHGPIDRLVQ